MRDSQIEDLERILKRKDDEISFLHVIKFFCIYCNFSFIIIILKNKQRQIQEMKFPSNSVSEVETPNINSNANNAKENNEIKGSF